MKARVLVALVLVFLLALAIASVAQANHVSEVEFCASHGLGPNFTYAEGSDSALIQCLERATSDHR
jgi:hypothetical protein